MKKSKTSGQKRGFVAGLVTALALCACVTASLAATGAVQFNQMELSLNGGTLLPKGENLTTESGASIPSSILYTDEQGGGTTYIPIRVLTEKLGWETVWDGEQGALDVRLTGDLALSLMSLNQAGKTWVGLMEEVEPVQPQDGHKLLDQAEHSGTQPYWHSFQDLDLEKGTCLSITVTNSGSAPVQFDLGFGTSAQAFTSDATQVPAGETVTRTVKLLSQEAVNEKLLSIRLRGAEGTDHTLDLTVDAVQFDG